MSGIRTWARLAYRQQRRELWLVALGVAITAGIMLWTAQSLDALRAAYPACAGSEPAPSCGPILAELTKQSMEAPRLLMLAFAAPFGLGVVLGAPIVAREVESGTAQLAWSLGRSRTGWLIRRVAFIVAITIASLALIAIASEVLASAVAAGRSLDADFAWSGRRGLILVARGVGALGIGILVGAVVGRVLPALLAAALVIGLAFTGVSLVHDEILRAEAEVVQLDEPYDARALMVNSGLLRPDGEVLTWEEARDRGYLAQLIDEEGRQYASEADMLAGRELGRDIEFVIPGDRYPAVTAREAAISAAAGFFAMVGAAMVVRRRRPA